MTATQALIWTHWQRTRLAAPAAVVALLPITLVLLYSGDHTAIRNYAEGAVPLHLLLTAWLYLMMDVNGAATNWALSPRLYALPVSARKMAAVSLAFPAAMISLLYLVLSGAVLALGARPAGPEALVLTIALFLVLYAGTLPFRRIMVLRGLIALLLAAVLIVATAQFLTVSEQMRIPRSVAMLVVSILASGWWTTRFFSNQRHGGRTRRPGRRSLAGRIAEELDGLRCFSKPRQVHGALLWQGLRGGALLALPVAFCLFVGVAILGTSFLASTAHALMGNAAVSVTTREMLTVGIVLLALIGGFALIGAVGAELSSNVSLVGGKPDDFLGSRPASSGILALAKTEQVLLGLAAWMLTGFVAGCVVVTVLKGWNDSPAVELFSRMIRDRGIAGSLWHAVLGGARWFASAWVFVGLAAVVEQTKRRWVALTIVGSIAIVALVAVVTVVHLNTGPLPALRERIVASEETVAVLLGLIMLLMSVGAMIVASYAKLIPWRQALPVVFFLGILVTVCFIGTLHEMRVLNRSLLSRPKAVILFCAGLHLLPFAPVGLLALATEWGRRR